MEIFFNKGNEDFLSNLSRHDLMFEHNTNSYYNQAFDVPEQNEFLENGYSSINPSTNFFSKNIKQEDDI